MVDITVTPTSVVAGANANIVSGNLAGETIAAGKLVYKSTATKKLMLSDTNSATVEARVPLGVALNGGSLNQPVSVQTAGECAIGATLTPGDVYYASDTPGGICPRADVGATENVVVIGTAKSAAILAIDMQVPGLVL